MKVAITGSIACGKSTVSNYIKEQGYQVIDADLIGHKIIDSAEVKKELIENFGEHIISDGKVDRAKLGSIVFNEKEKLNLLNSIVHPQIKNKIKIEFSNSTNKLIFLDVALLFEANFTDLVDKIIVVHVDKDTQITRLMKRNNFSKEEALKRINSQMSSDEKTLLADFVIDNSKTLIETFKQVDDVLRKLKG